jgi:RNA recognition motif-containing protein
MVKSVYVGNLPWSASEAEVRDLFAPFGRVRAVTLVKDRETGRPRGFGFVEMDDSGAGAAIEALKGARLGDRALRINEATAGPLQRPRPRIHG